MNDKANDFKIGLLVILAVAGLLALSYKVTNFSFARRGYAINVSFIDSNGVEKNAPVRLSGVEAGRVKDIELVYGKEGTRVLLKLWLNEKAKVRQDSHAFVTTLGIMGEKYVELTVGSANSAFLPPNSTIIGRQSFDVTKFMERGEQIADNLNQAINDLRSLTSGVNELIVVHRGDLDSLLKNLLTSSENIQAFTEDVKLHPWKLIRESKPDKPQTRKEKKSN